MGQACPGREATYIAVNQYPWASATYQMRLVETTLFSNWFFLGGDYGFLYPAPQHNEYVCGLHGVLAERERDGR